MKDLYLEQKGILWKVITLVIIPVFLFGLRRLPYFNLIVNPTSAFFVAWIGVTLLWRVRENIQFGGSIVFFLVSLFLLLTGRPKEAEGIATIAYGLTILGVFRMVQNLRQ